MYLSKRKNSPFIDNLKDSNSFSAQVNITKTQPDGKILIGGTFTIYGNISGRNCLIRLNSDGTPDTAFCANAVDGTKFSAAINNIEVQSDGKILIGGTFTDYGAVSGRSSLIRLNSDGTIDTTFCSNATDGNKFSVGSSITGLAVQTDGKILVSGTFSNYGTAGRNFLIRLNSNGTLDTAFCANATDGSKFNSVSYFIKVQPDGKILLGGGFTTYAGTANRNRLIRLNSDGTLDTTFCTNATDGAKISSTIYSIDVQSDGKILVGGAFTNYAGTVNRSYLIRLNSDGTLDTAFCTNATDSNKVGGTVRDIKVQSDGKPLICGQFISYGGTSGRSYLIRLNSDGTTDTAFCVNATDGTKFSTTVINLCIQPDQKILVGGQFLSYALIVRRSRLIRLNSDGTTDTSFCDIAIDGQNFSDQISTTAIQSDGKILLGGAFLSYNGFTGRVRLIRLNSDGTLDTAFCINATDGTKFAGNITKIQVQSDGKILVAGAFLAYAGTTNRNYLIRLNSDGTLDTSFCSNAVDGGKFSSSINSIEIQSDGKILIGGQFVNYGGTANRNRLVRLNSDGTLDTTFCTNAVDSAKFSAVVRDIKVQSDGKILVGGDFVGYAGTAGRSYFIRLNSDGTLDTAFCANATDGDQFVGGVYKIQTQSDGKILVGGIFTSYGPVSTRNRFIRLNSDGTVDDPFCVNVTDGKFNNIVYSIEVQSDGKILVGGDFVNHGALGSNPRTSLIRINSDGTIDTAFCANATDNSRFDNTIYDMKILQNSDILIVGLFRNYSSYTTNFKYAQTKISYITKLRENGIFK